MMQQIRIGKKIIGEKQPVFIIAEAGVNHNGNFSLAKKLIDAAAKAGADAVKFQTFSPDELTIKNAAKAKYQKAGDAKAGEGQYEMLKRLALPREWHEALMRRAEGKGLIFLSTPFSLPDAQFLHGLGLKAVKVGSSDSNNYPYLAKVAAWKLPILLSTGMANMEEIREAVNMVRKSGNEKLIIMHCTTNYPTPFCEANLRAIRTIQKEFNVSVGFSDHTLGMEASMCAVALGARVIERHITLDRDLPGPDHRSSLEPDEFMRLVKGVRNAEIALGSGNKTPFASEMELAKIARKSIVSLKTIKKGERFTEKNIGIKRPGTGLEPKYFWAIKGKRAARDISGDVLLGQDDYEK